MMLNCRKIREHRFIFFGEKGPDHNTPSVDSARPEDMRALEQREAKEKVEKVENPEEVAKVKEALEARHEKIKIRIDNAKEKCKKIERIADDLPPSDVRTTAEEACDKAKDKLVRIDRIFPKTIDLNSGSKDNAKPEVAAKPVPTDLQKIDAVLDKSSSQTGTVMKELSATEKAEMDAKKMIDSLKKFGIKDETINKIFKDNPAPEDVQLNIKDLQSLQISGMEDNFKKIIESINANGNFDIFSSNLNVLVAAKLKPEQITNILSRGDVCSGSMKVETIIKYLKTSQEHKFDTDFAIKVIDKVDLKKDIEPQLNKLQYFSKLQDSLKTQRIELFDKNLEDLYGKEKNADTVLAFLESVKDLSPIMAYKIALFLVESDPVKAREVFASVKDKTDVKGALEEKELADYKSKYPYISIRYLKYDLNDPARTENSLRFGRLIDNNPGLYAFMENEMCIVKKNSQTSQEEFEGFAKDPSLPLAYKIYAKLNGPMSGKLTFTTAKIEQCLDLARTLHARDAKPSEVDSMSKEQIEQEFNRLNNLSEKKGDINLYTYPATDAEGHMLKNPDGTIKMLSREFIFVAANDNNVNKNNSSTQGNTMLPHFLDTGLMESLTKSGADLGEKSHIEGKDENGKLIWMEDRWKNVFKASNKVAFDKDSEEENRKELVQLKTDLLNRIRDAKPPMTMCFNGHGSGAGLSLGDLPGIKGPDGREKLDPDSFISAKELAKAIKDRSEKFKGNPNLSNDIYLFSACATHEMVQDLLKKIKDDNSVQPIVSGATGHGINLNDNGVGGANFVAGRADANVRDLLITNNDETTGRHGYTYVPDEQNRATQITTKCKYIETSTP